MLSPKAETAWKSLFGETVRLASDELERRRQLEEYHRLRMTWRDYGLRQSLQDWAQDFAESSILRSHCHPNTWLVGLGVLIAGDRTSLAADLLSEYVDRYGVGRLTLCLPVAEFAYDRGYRGHRLPWAAEIRRRLRANREHGVIHELVADKTVAVVGNGDTCLGQGLGAEIDGHDIVIRFNNYPSGHEEDYGSRTSVWCRGSHAQVRDRSDITSYSLVLWEHDFDRNIIEREEHLDILWRDLWLYPERVANIDSQTKDSLRQTSGIRLPTTGCQTLWLLRQEAGSLENVDCYGFSFLVDKPNYGHFYDELGDMGQRHAVENETVFLRSLYAPAHASPGDALEVDPTSGLQSREPAPETIISCAYRVYDPAGGKTGGPGGVLATQRLLFGDELMGHPLRYVFQGARQRLTQDLATRNTGLRGKISDIIVASEFIKAHVGINETIRASGRAFFVCHELGSAFGAQQLGQPYVVVYHQQGSTLNEMVSIGQVPTPQEVAVANKLEATILENAEAVFFPSLGARDTFQKTSAIGASPKVKFADYALYNTLGGADEFAEADDPEALLASTLSELGIPPRDPDTDVFISIGDFNNDKGADRIPRQLNAYADLSGRKVRWLAIGSISSRELWRALQRRQPNWRFESHLIGRRVEHAKAMALLHYSDYYIMLHRNSIFDLACLEAMRAGLPMILSPVGGNLEFDVDGNVVFSVKTDLEGAAQAILSRDRAEWGARNKQAYAEHFSPTRFIERYTRMLREFASLT
jgi:glycosyltransferase involved in cell wall biosynthesis